MSLLGSIYGMVAGARNYLYDWGILPARRLPGPVVSVGNISAGGTGKTPFVMLLGGMLKERAIGFDVLSRGYGRRTRGVLLVDPNGSAQDFGDEPLLIARQLRCPVVVGENRHEAGLFAEYRFGPQLHILDDGFQHRSLARDFDIALVTPEDCKDTLLPGGRLREPLSSLHRADAVVLIGETNLPALSVPGMQVWQVRRDLAVGDVPQNPLVFCGIARPQRFVEQLQARGIVPAAQKLYRDHHPYSDADIQELIRIRNQNNAGGFITTEKDVVNLGSRISQLEPIVVAKVTMEITGPTDALDTVLRAIHDRKPQA